MIRQGDRAQANYRRSETLPLQTYPLLLPAFLFSSFSLAGGPTGEGVTDVFSFVFQFAFQFDFLFPEPGNSHFVPVQAVFTPIRSNTRGKRLFCHENSREDLKIKEIRRVSKEK
jgi:hypothetical protein